MVDKIINHFAFVFPGQGSQSIGMLSDIANQYNEVGITFKEASDVLHYDLWQLVVNGPTEELDKTTHTQPALLTAAYAIWKIIQSRVAFSPEVMAGHSLGEYTALVCANALEFPDAVQLVAARGQFMQEAVREGEGAMAAIAGLDENAVANICKQAVLAKEVLAPANFNSVGQVVIAGHKNSVLKAIDLAKEKGAKIAVLLKVSVPSHSELMKPAAERLAERLKTIIIQTPNCSIINNVDVKTYQTAEDIRDGLTRQLYMPVRWIEIIRAIAAKNITHIIECGPGKVLTGLNKRIDNQLQLMTTYDLANLESVLNCKGETHAA